MHLSPSSSPGSVNCSSLGQVSSVVFVESGSPGLDKSSVSVRVSLVKGVDSSSVHLVRSFGVLSEPSEDSNSSGKVNFSLNSRFDSSNSKSLSHSCEEVSSDTSSEFSHALNLSLDVGSFHLSAFPSPVESFS